MIDLHNHTTASYDGFHSAEEIIENAVVNGIATVGICDHQFTENFDFYGYIGTLFRLKEKYKSQIDVKIGLEIGTRPKPNDFFAKDMSKQLDYCLFESLDSSKGMDWYEFLDWSELFSCPIGLAHTDIFALSKKYGENVIKTMYEKKIFWEINTSGNYTYYYDFITNPEKQKRIKDAKITLSIGSDTHRLSDYSIAKLQSANALAKELKNPILFG